MGKSLLSLAALIALLIGPSLATAAETTPLGKKIDNFSARDFRGKEISLADLASSKLVVVAFVGTECPQAKLYAPRLVELAEEFKAKKDELLKSIR